jgi:cytochrome c oxidase subunit 4
MTNPTAPAGPNPPAGHGAHKAPNYMMIWVYLAVLTVVEVLVAFVSGMPFVILVIALLLLAFWKALLVALYYMHLKFEPRKLWIIASIPIPLIIIFLGVVLMERF